MTSPFYLSFKRKVIFKARFIANVEPALYSIRNTHMGAWKLELKSQLCPVVAVNVPSLTFQNYFCVCYQERNE